MKLKDIVPGKAYNTKSGDVLVLDVGKFSACFDESTARTVRWKSFVIHVGRSWYREDLDKRNQVVVAFIHRHSVEVISAAAIQSVVEEGDVDIACKRLLQQQIEAVMSKAISDQRAAFRTAQRDVIETILRDHDPKWEAPDNLRSNSRTTPHSLLVAEPDVINELLLVWLAWKSANGFTIGEEDPKDLSETYIDILRGLKSVDERIAALPSQVVQQVDVEWQKIKSIPVSIDIVSEEVPV